MVPHRIDAVGVGLGGRDVDVSRIPLPRNQINEDRIGDNPNVSSHSSKWSKWSTPNCANRTV